MDCIFCNGTIYPDDEKVSKFIGTAHFECAAMDDLRRDEEMKEIIEMERKQERRENKLISRLKKTLKPKVYGIIKMIYEEHRVGSIDVISFKDIEGSKEVASDWFGVSVPIRYVWDATSTDYWGDGYGGYVTFNIGKGRYIRMHVWG